MQVNVLQRATPPNVPVIYTDSSRRKRHVKNVTFTASKCHFKFKHGDSGDTAFSEKNFNELITSR